MVDTPTEEYGVPVFGRDYNVALSRWVSDHYRQVDAYAAGPDQAGRFGIRLLERADRAKPR